MLSALDTTWDLASKGVLAHVSTFAQCLGATKLTRRQSISGLLDESAEVSTGAKKRKLRPLDIEHKPNDASVKPHRLENQVSSA